MDDAGNQHSVRLLVVENNVMRVFMAPRSGRKLICLAANARIGGKKFKALNHALALGFRLCQTECLKPVQEHLQKIVIGVFCEPIFTHASAHAPWRFLALRRRFHQRCER